MTEQIDVLHVDDDPDLGELTATFLEREDSRFTVQTATNAAEGLESLEDSPPACVVSDYDMPGKNGIEFLRAVREDYPDIPFILFTGKGGEEVASEAISAGVTDYLQKKAGTEQYELLANRISNVVEGRRATQAASRQKELMHLTELAGDTGGWELDPDTEEFLLTEGSQQLIGLPSDESITLQEAFDSLHPDDREEARVTVDEVIQTGESVSRTWRLQPRDEREERLLDVTITPVTSDGDVEVLRGAINDITDIRKRQRELRRLQQAIDGANVAITLADPSKDDNPLVYVNDAYEQLTGYSTEEAMGQNCRYLQGEDTDPEQVATLREAIDAEEPVTVDLRNYRKDGTEFWNRLTVTPIYDDDGTLIRYLGTQEDITERKEREQQLAETRDLLSSMEKYADVGAWEYDIETEELTITAGMRRICDIPSKTNMTLAKAFEFFHPDDRDQLRDQFGNCLETGEPCESDVRLGTDDDERRWMTVRGERVQDGATDDVVRGYLQEITERKTRERQLTELNKTTQRLSRAQSRQEVAEVGTEATRGILGFQANSLHFATEDGTELAPAAQTEESVSLIGDAPTLPVDGSIAGRIYRDGESTVIEDVHQDPDIHNPDTNLMGHCYLPLGDHGVLIAGSAGSAAFNDTDLSVADLLAGNLVAALDRVEHAETARQRLEQLSLFFEESPLGAVQWDETFRFDHLNERAQEILGYSEDELRGESWERIVADSDHDQVQNAVKQLLDADGGTRVINENITQSGEVRTCEWHNRAVTGADGEVRSVFSKFYDVTDRERHKQQLEEYETVLKTLSDAVYVLDENGRFTYVNDEFVELVGYDRETIIGNTPSLFKDEETVTVAEQQLGRLLSEDGPETVTFEITIQPRDGDPVVCEDHMCVLPYEGESFKGSVGTLRDVTERKERTRELERQNDRLDEFASVVSHDLRNPLLVAEGRLELAQAECECAHLADIADAIERSQTLIDDLLTLARGGDVVGGTEEVSVSALAEECWQVVPSEKATLAVDSNQTIIADRSRVQQLLENLLTNAVEHGGEDVTISVGDLADGFYIADDGVGIPDEERDSIFEAGYSTVEDGTGFGLRIVKQVVDAHGWEIRIAETDNGGVRFEITGVDTAE